jgi:dephospho-CoA kinase
LSRKPVRLGLTGGIGSGKSTLASLLAQAGAAVLDADAISRSLTQPGGRAIPGIMAEFGEQLMNPQGAMDREAMRALVFSNPQSKRQLEAILHPLIGQILQEETSAALSAGHLCLVYDVPLLVESGERWRRQVDWVCVVDCEVETQIQRVMARSQLSRPDVERIISQQANRQLRLASSDMVIFNEGIDLAQLKHLAHEMMARFGL